MHITFAGDHQCLGGEGADEDSGLVQGDTYMFSGSPVEQANKAMHDALSLVMSNAADDVYEFLKTNSDS